VKHAIHLSSGAKKSQLVQIFHADLAPLVPGLRYEAEQVVPSVVGTIDVGAAQDPSRFEDGKDEDV